MARSNKRGPISEVNGILGERAVVLSGLPLSHNGHARITAD
jgi:hypothetical protein